jgi:hypothetical protein
MSRARRSRADIQALCYSWIKTDPLASSRLSCSDPCGRTLMCQNSTQSQSTSTPRFPREASPAAHDCPSSLSDKLCRHLPRYHRRCSKCRPFTLLFLWLLPVIRKCSSGSFTLCPCLDWKGEENYSLCLEVHRIGWISFQKLSVNTRC